MTEKNAKKIGFLSALSICFTSIVGIGVFIKNASVGKNFEGNGASWLITWIICGLLAILLAFHFGKISRLESETGMTGLSAWTHEVTNKKTQWFNKVVSVNYGFFYNPILSLCLMFFCSEFFFEFLKAIDPSTKVDLWVHVIVVLVLGSFMVITNYFSVKFSGLISITTSILKFIPLLMVIMIGIIFWNVHNLPVENNSTNGFNKSISFAKAIQGIMLSIPSVLFSFDSFIGIGAWSKNIKGGEKTVSKVIITAMILVTVVYCLISIASILHYNTSSNGTSILNVLIDSLPKNAERGIAIFVSLFIFISGFGTSNSVCGSTIKEFRNMIINRKVILTRRIYDRFGERKGTMALTVTLLSFWFLIIFIPSIIMQNDSLIDGFSNIVVVFIFLAYGYLILLFWNKMKQDQNEFKTFTRPKFYSFLVWAALVATICVSFLNVFFVFFEGIRNWSASSNWGLFYVDGIPITNLGVLIFYICFSIVFCVFPFINYWIVDRNKL